MAFFGVPPACHLADLRQDIIDESLAAKTRMDRHAEHDVNELPVNVAEFFQRRFRVDREARAQTGFSNPPERDVDRVFRFNVDADARGPGLDESFQVILGVRDHQVDIKRQTDAFFDRGRHARSEADIGDKMAIHDVQVKPVGPGQLGPPGLLGKMPEIAR